MKKIIILFLIMVSIFGALSTGIGLTHSVKSRYSINNNLIEQISKSEPGYTSIKNIPLKLKQAVIAAEDKRFYQHHGFDLIAILRSIYTDIKTLKFKEGGSTITQQLAKNLFLSNDKSIMRKLKELAFSIELENKYSKDQILEMYLNVIYYGSDIYGAENASKIYFKKDVKDLTLGECALLAGIPQCPNFYNPALHPKEAKARQIYVLKSMLKNKFINKSVEKMEEGQTLSLASK